MKLTEKFNNQFAYKDIENYYIDYYTNNIENNNNFSEEIKDEIIKRLINSKPSELKFDKDGNAFFYQNNEIYYLRSEDDFAAAKIREIKNLDFAISEEGIEAVKQCIIDREKRRIEQELSGNKITFDDLKNKTTIFELNDGKGSCIKVEYDNCAHWSTDEVYILNIVINEPYYEYYENREIEFMIEEDINNPKYHKVNNNIKEALAEAVNILVRDKGDADIVKIKKTSTGQYSKKLYR